MKRERELEETVKEIVVTANTKDREGRYVHSLMREEDNPMVLTFFHAPEALMEVLMNRPVLFLNLLQTSSTLATFWCALEKNIWILLLERLIEMERGKYAAELYPFFFVERRHTSLEESKVGAWVALSGPEFTCPDLEIGSVDETESIITGYYAVYYEEDTTNAFKRLRAGHDSAIHDIGKTDTTQQQLRKYLGLNEDTDKEKFVACMSNCFLVLESDIQISVSKDRTPLSSTWWRIFRGFQKWQYGMYGDEPEPVFDEADLKFERELREQHADTNTPLLLNAKSIALYRDRMYGSENGLYNTVEKQRALFLEALGSMGKSKQAVIEKYGCVMCQTQTNMIDPLRSLAFCGTQCHALYLK